MSRSLKKRRLVPATPARETSRIAALCFALAALVLALYGQTVRHDFVAYDDPQYVYNNPVVTNGLTFDGTLQAFSRREIGLWTPVVTLSHMFDWQLYGPHAGGHHLTNVLLHLISTILLFLFLRQLTGSLWRSFFIAGLFAVHPLRVESIAWIAERKDALSGLFFLLTLAAYLRYVRGKASIANYALALLSFSLGLMSKPMLVTVPFVLLLLDYWPLQRLFRSASVTGKAGASVNWRVLLEKLPLILLSVAICLATLIQPPAPQSFADSPEYVPFLTRLTEAPVWVVIYIGQMIWPAGLAPIYPRSAASVALWPLALTLLVIASGAIYLWRRKHPALWMGWLWNLGMLVPVSGILQISRHHRADHYNYLPQIGLYIGLTWLAADLTEPWRHAGW